MRKNQKLSMRYFGPFKIIQKIGSVAYILPLPEGARIHPVFHVSLLKKCEGDLGSQVNSMPLPLIATEIGPSLQPKAILQQRTFLRNSEQIEQILVQWEGMMDSENSWEDVEYMRQYFPSIILEDKDVFNGGGCVMQGVKLAGESLEPRKLKIGSHVQGRKIAEVDKLADVETSPLMIRRSNRERCRITRLAGYLTPRQVAIGEDSIGCEEGLVTPSWQLVRERLMDEDS